MNVQRVSYQYSQSKKTDTKNNQLAFGAATIKIKGEELLHKPFNFLGLHLDLDAFSNDYITQTARELKKLIEKFKKVPAFEDAIKHGSDDVLINASGGGPTLYHIEIRKGENKLGIIIPRSAVEGKNDNTKIFAEDCVSAIKDID